MLDGFVLLIFPALWSLFPIYLFLTYRVQRALKLRHNALWVELGEPSLKSASPIAVFRFLSFCLSGRVRRLGDVSLSRLVFFWRVGAACCLIAILLIASFVFVGTRLSE